MSNNQHQTKFHILVRGAAAVFVAVTIFFLTYFDVFESIDNHFSDIIYADNISTTLPITILEIDDKTMDKMGQPSTWSRQVYADLINILCTDEYSSSVIIFDQLFTGYKDLEGDLAFADACKRAGNVIVGVNCIRSDFFYSENGMQYYDDTHVEAQLPYDELLAVTGLATTNNGAEDSDGYIRTFIAYENCEGIRYNCLAIEGLKAFGVNDITLPPNQSNQFRFSFSGAPGDIENISLCDVLDNPSIAKSIKNRIILVGAYATGLADAFFVPTSNGDKMYGVEIHANIMEAIYNNRIQVEVDNTLVAMIYGLVVGCFVFLLSGYSLAVSAAISAVAIIIHLLFCRIMNSNGLYIKPIYFTLGIIVLYSFMLIFHYISAMLERNKINKAFKMYVAPQIVDEVAKTGSYELKLGGQNKDIAVMFVDIRGFTTMSENLHPEEVVDILNEYFAIITDAIFKNGGTLDKFIGDAAMAVFNSPFDLDDYEFCAVKTAWDIASGSESLRQRLMERFGKTISYGIGVNCGEAVIGNIGCDFRMDFTAIGDTVNTASRLESNARAGQILISAEVADRLKGRLELEEIGEIPLKGKSKNIFVYNVKNINLSE